MKKIFQISGILLSIAFVFIIILFGFEKTRLSYIYQFPNTEVILTTSKSIDDTSYSYDCIFLEIKNNDTKQIFQKDWKWEAGLVPDQSSSGFVYVNKPQVDLIDFNNDKTHELIIQLENGINRGINIREIDIHIMDLNGDEYFVESPFSYLTKNVASSVTRDKSASEIQISINLGTQVHEFNIPLSEFPNENIINHKIGYTNWCEYIIKNNILYAKIPFAISTSPIGEFLLEYKLIDRKFNIVSVTPQLIY